MPKEDTISNLSQGFLENSLWHSSKSIRTYLKNCADLRESGKHRKLIAYHENRHATSSLLNSYTALEYIITTEAFHQNLQDFDSGDNAIEKVKKLGIFSEDIILALTELSIPRDTISHAYLWKTQRTWDDDYNIVEVTDAMWDKYLANLRNKYKCNVQLDVGVTNEFLFNIVPDKIDYLDSVKALYLVNKIYVGLLENSGTSWRPLIFPYKQDGFPVDVYNVMNKKYSLDDWVKYLTGNLCEDDLGELKTFTNKLG